MNKTQSNCLILFTEHYIDIWQNTTKHAPISSELYGVPSPCIIDTIDLAVLWLPIRPSPHSLAIAEEVANIRIHDSAHLFYGTQYAGDMQAQWHDLSLSLIQVWSDDDFSRLEQNIIAHLMMQKKLKRRPTIFIATTNDEAEIIAIDNKTGNIILEKLITNETKVLASDLDTFLSNLTPIAQ
ncbi:SecY-interacting protein [Orbus sturtevantii]|uniref:SecY-interacting protein n=1 Tax=Orbus sturtevantii TaxID=3074109 RepID=UPI00370D4CCD